MNDYNFDNALSIKSIDEIDMTKINEAIEVISNSNLIKNLSNIVKIVRIQLPEDLKGFNKYEDKNLKVYYDYMCNIIESRKKNHMQ